MFGEKSNLKSFNDPEISEKNYFAEESKRLFVIIDNRLRQMAVFVFVKVGGVRGKGRLSSHVERF